MTAWCSSSRRAGPRRCCYSFTGGSDGAGPLAGLIADSSGNLYGTTVFGGASGQCGVVFKLSPGGTETVLYSFTGRQRRGSSRSRPDCRQQRQSLRHDTLGGASEFIGVVFKLAGTGFVPPMPFAAFSANARDPFRHGANTDALKLQSSFTLGSASNGINPVAEPVTLQIGTFATTIPPGSFTGTQRVWAVHFRTVRSWRAPARGGSTPTGTKRYAFQAAAQNANLTGTVNPVPVTLTIGDDSGTTSVTATIVPAPAAAH